MKRRMAILAAAVAALVAIADASVPAGAHDHRNRRRS